MKDYIKMSSRKLLKEWKEFLLFKKIPVTILKQFSNDNIQLNKILSIVEQYLKNPKYVSFIEGIYIGTFPELENRQIQAMFNDGVVYVSNIINDYNNENRIAKDIIHEIGHSIENYYNLELYGDTLLEEEFLAKRHKLYNLLKYDGIELPKSFLYSGEYSEEIDNILYNIIGYDKLNLQIIGLFLSPYCVTTESEFFANGFENYYTEDSSYLKSICPILYNKIKEIDKLIKKEKR